MTARKKDENGYWEIKDQPISMVGVHEYLGSELPKRFNLDPNRAYRVFTPPETLSDPEAIESIKLSPFVEEHTMLGDGETPPEEKGVEGTTGENVYFRDGTLYANLKIWSKDLKRKIESGKKGLSLGYRIIYEKMSGVWNGQSYDFVKTRLRGNHLASVKVGRMGQGVAVLDETAENARYETLTFEITGDFMGNKNTSGQVDESPDEVKKEAGTGQDIDPGQTEGKEMGFPMSGHFAAQIQNAVEPMMKGLGSKIDGLSKRMDAYDEKMKAYDQKMTKNGEKEDKGMDAAPVTREEFEALQSQVSNVQDAATVATQKVLADIEEKNALADQVSDVVGVFDHAPMDLQAVAKYGCEKLKLEVSEGEEVGAIKGYLAARSAENTIVLDSKPAKSGSLDEELNKTWGNA